MKIKKLLFFLMVVLTQQVVAQNKQTIDSLRQRLPRCANDSDRASTLAKLGWEVSYNSLSEGLIYAKQALALSQQINDKPLIATAWNIIGTIYEDLGEYTQATEAHLNSIRLREELKDTLGLGQSYHNISLVYQSKGDTASQLKYQLLSYNIYYTVENEIGLSATCGTLGMTYLSMDSIDQARQVFTNGLYYSRRTDKPRRQITNLIGLALCDATIGKDEDAEKNLQQVLAIRHTVNSDYDFMGIYTYIGRLRFTQKRYTDALNYYDSSMVIAKRLAVPETQKDIWQSMANVYQAQNDFKNTLNALQHYQSLKDSLLNENVLKHQHELEVIYQSEKKDHDIQLLQQGQKTQNTFLLILIVACVLLVGAALLFWNRIRFRQRSSKMLAEQSAMIEEKNKDITDSINYARRIQEAMLPDQELIRVLFPDFGILFQPKEIVSGDFYWAMEKENLRFIAAADCTGHGVPGGFMSVMGAALLSEIVVEQKVNEPALILDRLRSRIISSLRQSDQDRSTGDGLDIVLCVFDQQNKKLHYAAARCQLWRIRKGEVDLLPHDDIPVGITAGTLKSFSTHTLDVLPDDLFLLLTDGLSLQTDSQQKNTYGTDRLRHLMANQNGQSAQALMAAIQMDFLEWKGKADQTDDILAIMVSLGA